MVNAMQLIIAPGGEIRCIYSEAIDLAALGSPRIGRASHVEPDQHGCWLADLSPVGGPLLTGFQHRSEALAAEQAWLETHGWAVVAPSPVALFRRPMNSPGTGTQATVAGELTMAGFPPTPLWLCGS